MKTDYRQILKCSKEEVGCRRCYQPVNLTLVNGAVSDGIIRQMDYQAVEKEAGIVGSQNGFTKNWSC